MLSPRLRQALTVVLIGVPLISLAVDAVSWLRFGLDIPFYDDLRAYGRGAAASLALKDIFRPSNDTLYPVGMALDALAVRYLSGNVVAYQFLSILGLIGGLLLLQWRLLSWALGDRLIAAACFCLGIFLMQPGTYWGLQALAYHQGLPTLFLCLAVFLVLSPHWKSGWGVPAVFVLGVLAGLTYISGAFAGLAAGVTMIGLGMLQVPNARALRAGGTALLAAAIPTAAVQSWVIVQVQGGRIHDPVGRWTLPVDIEYWAYLLGKVARALALPFGSAVLDVTLTIVLAGLVVLFGVLLVRRLLTGPQADLPQTRVATVFLIMFGLLAGYLAILAAGRAGLRGPGLDRPIDAFWIGYQGFHFFWITLFLPWIAAAGYVVCAGSDLPLARRLAPGVAIIAVVISLWAILFGGVVAHAEYYNKQTAWRLENDAKCIRHAMRHGTVPCPTWYDEKELLRAIDHARTIEASFTRYIPPELIPVDSNDPPPLFRFSTGLDQVEYVNLTPPERTNEGFVFAPGDDPILVVKLPEGTLRTCTVLEVSATQRITEDDSANIYLLRKGQTQFTAPPSASATLIRPQAGFITYVMTARNAEGFEDQVRLDPVSRKQAFTLKDFVIRCRVHRAQTG